jgi:integrase
MSAALTAPPAPRPDAGPAPLALVPDPCPDPPYDDRDAFEESLTDGLDQRSRAPRTRAKYEPAWDRFEQWCRLRGLTALPADPDTVRRYLALRLYGALELDPAGLDPASMRPVMKAKSLGADTGAINDAHERAGLPSPTRSYAVRRLLRGARRRTGVAADEPMRPLVYDDLVATVAAVNAPRVEAVRRELIGHLARALPEATAGQLARLRWSELRRTASGLHVDLSATRRHGPRRTCAVRTDRGAGRDLADALDRWAQVYPRRDRDAVVLCHLDGDPLTAHGIRKAASAAAATGDGAGDLRAARDTALLLTGYFTGMRADNLTMLRWRDATDTGSGSISLVLVSAKDDQEGRGHTVALHESAPGLLCAATALRAWRAAMTQALGCDPVLGTPDAAMFPALTRHGTLSQRRRSVRVHDQVQDRTGFLVTDAVTELVQRYARLAGLDRRETGRRRASHGGHSLRAGFISDCIAKGVSIAEIALVTGHSDPRQVQTYVRHLPGKLNVAGALLIDRLAADATGTRPSAETESDPSGQYGGWTSSASGVRRRR